MTVTQKEIDYLRLEEDQRHWFRKMALALAANPDRKLTPEQTESFRKSWPEKSRENF
jgi:hypothetical protein